MAARPVKRLVKSTQEELKHAFAQLQSGTFLNPDARR